MRCETDWPAAEPTGAAERRLAVGGRTARLFDSGSEIWCDMAAMLGGWSACWFHRRSVEPLTAVAQDHHEVAGVDLAV
jgi:hypothetical protein